MKKLLFLFLSLIILFTFPATVLAEDISLPDEESTTSPEVTSGEVYNGSDEEPTTQSEVVSSDDCNHNWEVVAFDAAYNVITLKCSDCDLIHTIDFADCLTNFNANDEYFSAVDVNNDGVINGRDYSYLVRGFTNLLQTDSFINMFSSKQFLYKEMFLYIYLTVLFIVSTGFICYSVRRSK